MKVREQYSTDDLLSLALRSVARSKGGFNVVGLASLDNDRMNEWTNLRNSRRTCLIAFDF